jgi:hypothetical protein
MAIFIVCYRLLEADYSLSPAAARTIRRSLKLQNGNEQQIDNVYSVIRLNDNHGAPAGCRHDKLAMHNGHIATIRHVHHERLKRLGIVHIAEAVDSHSANSAWGSFSVF